VFSSESRRKISIFVLFSVCLIFFLNRGAYRAIRFSTTGDLSTVYASARCWMHGNNPYDRALLKAELAQAGAPEHIQHDQEINPSVYLPAAMPIAASVAWMPWSLANVLWCLLALILFGISLFKLLEQTSAFSSAKWLVACAALLFCPTYVGIYDGNPAVIAISLTTLAIVLVLRGSLRSAGILLGIALCFKPQIALCAVCVFALWRYWKSILIGAAVFCFATGLAVAVLSGSSHSGAWWQTEQRNVLISFQPGGQSDPTPGSAVGWQLLNAQTLVSYVFNERSRYDVAVWIFSALLVIVFLILRKKSGNRSPWHDAAFFSSVTLLITYHRYYDAQLLLLEVPFLLSLWRTKRKPVVAVLISVCLALLAFPTQSIFARRMEEAATEASIRQFVLLRHQPMAVLTLAIVLAFCCASMWSVETGTAEHGVSAIPTPSPHGRRPRPPDTPDQPRVASL
jgi:Glycosyltransferase family 87